MSFHSVDQTEKRTNAEHTASIAILQCKSGCDLHTFNSGKCSDLHSSEQVFNPVSIGTFAASRFGHDFSLVPAHTEMVRQTTPLLHTGAMVQRFPVNEDANSEPAPENAPTPTTAEPETESAAPEETTTPALIVENSATELAPGEMRKSEFLAQLRTEITRTAEAAMAGTGRTTADCPYLDYWFSYYEEQDSTHIERALRRYAPEASSATTAREYIPIIAERVRRSVETWVRTGEIMGLPEGLPGMDLLGSIGGLVSSVGSIFRKARNGSERKVGDPRAIQTQLGSGQPLENRVRSRMESAFGMDFSHVRTHTDTTAAGLSNRLNARAFTVGKHVAFGSGEYRPGTLIGDALIAHEMAHVVQQRSASTSVAPMQTGSSNYNMLENDADTSAISVLASLWGSAKGKLVDVGQNAIPRLRSGLRLQRCKRPQYVTNLGANVTVLESGMPPSVPDLTEAQANSILSGLGLLSSVTKVAPPSNRYDCHGYTFLGGDRWINNDQVDTILSDNGYSVTTTPSVGDIVIYRSGGSVTHSGIIRAISGTTVTQIDSKWGRAGLYRHAPDDVPPAYGSWTPYHTSRSGGHRLRRRP